MNYSQIASEVSNLNANLLEFISKMNSFDFSEWSGTASTTTSEKLEKCIIEANKQSENLTSFASALNYVDLYKKTKEEKQQLTNSLNNLDKEATNYRSNYTYYSNQISNATSKMNEYKRKAISELSNISKISSVVDPVTYYSPTTNNEEQEMIVPTQTSPQGVIFYNDEDYSWSTPSYNYNGEQNSTTIPSNRPDRPSGSSIVDYNALGDNFTVVNTKMSVQDYLKVISSRGIKQNSNKAVYGDLCLAFAYVHAYSMYTGNTSAGAASTKQYTYASNFKGFTSDNKQEILNKIYEEITNGKPVIVQVNGNSSGTSRHYVTVVGFNKKVSSASELTEDDLLIIDSWDGALENMSSSTSRFMTTGAQTGKNYSGYQIFTIR